MKQKKKSKAKSIQWMGPLSRKKSKKGQMFMIGIMMVIMAILIFIATLPATKELINDARGCSNLNCAGYIDNDASGGNACIATNQTYVSTLEEDTLSCTVLDLAIPFLILGVLSAAVFKIVRGEAIEQPQQFGSSY